MSFNEKLRELRKERKLKQWEMADMLDTDRSTITKWETGKSKPSSDMLVMIAGIFNVSVDYLLSTTASSDEPPLEQKSPISGDGLSENKKALIAFAETVPEDKAEMILRVMKSIIETD